METKLRGGIRDSMSFAEIGYSRKMKKTMENLARYVVRASFTQERMIYIPEESKVIYQSKDGKAEMPFYSISSAYITN